MLTVEDLRHRHGDRDGLRNVLAVAGFTVAADETLLVLGDSGSGKTTLIHVLAGLLRPTSGRVTIAGQPLDALTGSALDRFRGRTIGLVPQRLHLIDSLDVQGNLRLARYLAGLPIDASAIHALLERLGIAARTRARVGQLSQGEAQRVAVARAVINRPKVLLADEPTANLDDRHAQAALDLLESQARACGAALVIATHDRRVKDRFGRSLLLESPR